VSGAVEPGRYTALTRVLHWLTAVLVFCALSIGFVMVNSVHDYATLIMIHRTLGVTILVVVLVRLVNRLTHRAPPPPTVGGLERRIVVLSEVSLYAMLLLQPLIGWAMVSAAGGPVVVFGSLRLPRIAPFDAQLFWLLRQAHSVVAYALTAAVTAHVSAILLHTLTLRDRMIERMTFRFRPKADRTRLG
jgi:cytochrome b561